MKRGSSVETKQIAERLCALERTKRDLFYSGKGLYPSWKEKIHDKLWIELSNDMDTWFIWKRYSDQARPFFKTIPKKLLSFREIEKMLSNQPWICT